MKIYPGKRAMLVRVVLLVVGIVILSAKECEMGPGGDGDKPVTFAYICTNGTAVDGTTGTENTEKCSACNSGFKLSSVKQCVVPGDETPPAVVTLTASLPSPSVGTVKLDWAEPADTDFSHLLISWTPASVPAVPAVRVNKGTITTVIGASGLISGTAYTFTAISVDTSGNESADSAGATATPVFSCDSPLFATTAGTTYAGSVNVASGAGTEASPYLIPLIDGVLTTCPIEIAFDHSAVDPVFIIEYFRIDNMPTGASYTSSTVAWVYKGATAGGSAFAVARRVDGEIPTSAVTLGRQLYSVAKGQMICGAGSDASCAMGTKIDNADLISTSARTFGLFLQAPSITDSLTLTLTP